MDYVIKSETYFHYSPLVCGDTSGGVHAIVEYYRVMSIMCMGYMCRLKK